MAIPKGKLVKVTDSFAPIIIKEESTPIVGPSGINGVNGRDGKDGKPGLPGKDAPSLEEILKALVEDPRLLTAISKAVGEQTLGALGGSGKLDVQDLPGYRKATAGQIFGVGANRRAGFYNPEVLGISGESAVEYKTLIDTVGDYKYVGEATPGTATSAASWRIKRIAFLSGDDVEIKWANSVNTFSQVWDDRASLSYN